MTQPPPPPFGPPPSGPPPQQQPPTLGVPPQGPPPAYPPQYSPVGYPAPFPPAPRRSRFVPVVLAVVVAIALVATAVLVPLLLTGDDEADDRSADDSGSQGSVDTSTLAAVATYDDLPTTHLEIGEDHSYAQSPAVGGPHAPVWIECGVHDEPLPEVNAVHDLEHGTTWITYRPDDVDDDGVDRLADQLPANGLLSPYPDQAAPVVITVWGRQLELTGPDDPRIALFVAEYGAGDTAPEPYASCNGGVDPADLAGSGVSA